MEYVHYGSISIGAIGVLVIFTGVVGGLWRFVRSEFAAARGENVRKARQRLRGTLGYYLLLGLEFLIAADIIETLVKPSMQELIVLGAIVAIRTVISYSLASEPGREAPTERSDEETTAYPEKAVS